MAQQGSSCPQHLPRPARARIDNGRSHLVRALGWRLCRARGGDRIWPDLGDDRGYRRRDGRWFCGGADGGSSLGEG